QLDQRRNVFLAADQQHGVGTLQRLNRHGSQAGESGRIDLIDHVRQRGAVDVLQIVDFDGRLELQALLLDLLDDLQHAIDVFLAAADHDYVFQNLDLHIVDPGDGFHRGN